MSDVEREFIAAARASLIEAGRAASRWPKENVRWKQLGRTAVALMRLAVDFYLTRNSAMLLSILILASLCIGAARIGYGLPGLMLHALVILAASGVSLFAQHIPCVRNPNNFVRNVGSIAWSIR